MTVVTAEPFEYDPDDLTPYPSIEGLADRLTHLAQETAGRPTVALLNGPWGSGKSTFLRAWVKRHRQRTGGVVISLDASEASLGGDPFWSLIEVAGCALEQLHGDWRRISLRNRLGAAARSVAVNIASKATGGILTPEAIEQTMGGSRGFPSLEEVFQRRQAREEFRGAFRAIVAAVQQRTGLPLVVAVDDLDRVPPAFALETIRLIHHLFLAPGSLFVLIADLRQLEQAVCTIHGVRASRRKYLEKYWGQTIPFPRSFQREREEQRHYEDGFRSAFARCRLEEPVPGLVRDLAAFARATSVVVRDMERIAEKVAFGLGTLGNRVQPVTRNLIVILAVLFHVAPELEEAALGMRRGQEAQLWRQIVQRLPRLTEVAPRAALLVADGLEVPHDDPARRRASERVAGLPADAAWPISRLSAFRDAVNALAGWAG